MGSSGSRRAWGEAVLPSWEGRSSLRLNVSGIRHGESEGLSAAVRSWKRRRLVRAARYCCTY